MNYKKPHLYRKKPDAIRRIRFELQRKHRMNEKSAILSFRINPELKRKLEIRAKIDKKTLTEFVRDTLSHSQGEAVLNSARKEFTELESDAQELNNKISDFNKQYRSMLETLTTEQKGLINELSIHKQKLKRDRLFDALQMAILCLIGSLIGGFSLQVINYFAK